MTSLPTPIPARRGFRWTRLKRFETASSDSLRSQVEESIPLRCLVQLLASTGILATDIAAGTWMSFWAIPLSALGCWWSWRQRHKKNIATKFGLAFGMLVALGFFLTQLLASPNDNRLVLAELLVQLQVLHSFDLPRRKNLGYSMMIGLVLLGVAGTLSQTSAFGILLLIFLAIALPTLVLDYRSRLGVAPEPWRWRSPVTELPLVDLAKFFALVLALGLTIFAGLPRIPASYHLRSFPVSSTINFQGEFKGSKITNPGYIRAGSKTAGSGSGQSAGGGAAENTAYYGFSNTMDQRSGAMSPMKPKVVLRVRSQAPGFWRVLSFDHYSGHGWDVSRKDQVRYLNRDDWSYQFYLQTLNPSVRSQEVVQTYTVVSELPNLVPTLPNAKTVYFPTQHLAIDPENTLRSPVILTEDLTYTVISDVPYRDLNRLKQAPITYAPPLKTHYLQVPEPVAAELKTLAQGWLAKANAPVTNPYDTAWFLAQYLKQHYNVQADIPQLGEGQDLAKAFVQKQGGYPDHFSTVLTLMLRSLGIPARLAVGFSSGQFNPFTGFYVVQNTDAHAITEIYIPDNGWFGFDPIPGHEVIPPSIEENQTFGILRQFWHWVAGWMPSPVRNGLGTMMSWLMNGISQMIQGFFGLFNQGWQGIITGLTLGVGGAYGLWLAWQGWQRWCHWRWLSQLPPMERLYQQFLITLNQVGHPKSVAQTPLEFAHQLQEISSPPLAQSIEAIAEAYVSWRYGDRQPNIEELKDHLKQLQALLKPHSQLKIKF